MEKRELSGVDREIVSTLLETGAVNFEAIGSTIARVGANSVMMEDDGWIRWCGSDLRTWRWPRHSFVLEDLVVLREIISQMPILKQQQ